MDTLYQELKSFIIETMNLEDITPAEIANRLADELAAIESSRPRLAKAIAWSR